MTSTNSVLLDEEYINLGKQGALNMPLLSAFNLNVLRLLCSDSLAS